MTSPRDFSPFRFAAAALFVLAYFGIATSHAGASPDSTRTLAWGANYSYQLGISSDTSSSAPVVVKGGDNLHSLSAWGPQVMAIGENGDAYAWGDDSSGQSSGHFDPCCGGAVGKPNDLEVKATSVGQGGNYAVRPDGSVVVWGGNGYKVIESLGNVKSIAVGNSFFGGGFYLALLNDGTVKAWGSNQYGQLGLGTTESRTSPKTIPGLTGVKAIAAGNGQGIALMNDGTVKRWGGLFTSVAEPDSTLLVPTDVPGITSATAVSASTGDAMALLSDGTIKAWGQNYFGILGDGTDVGTSDPVTVEGISSATAIAAGAAHSLALLADGTMRVWGRNDQGQFGIYGMAKSLTPVAVPGLKGIVAIAASDGASYAIQDKSQPVGKLTLEMRPESEFNEGVSGSGFSNGYGSLSFPVGVQVAISASEWGSYASFDGWSGLCTEHTGGCLAKINGDATLGYSFTMLPKYQVAPDTRMTAHRAPTGFDSAFFIFRATGPGGHIWKVQFECRLIRKFPPKAGGKPAFRPCHGREGNSSNKRYQHLRNGRYVFQVRATTRYGIDTTPDRYAFRIKKKTRPKHPKKHGSKS